MNQKLPLAIFCFSFFFIPFLLKAQCCAGGGGSPIAGGTSYGVLYEGHYEISTIIQYISSNKFYSKNKINSQRTFDGYNSLYDYLKFAYGVSKDFTMSIESGYYINKEEIGLNKNPESTFKSSGFGDLIIFPRYRVLNKTNEKHHTEITLGLGCKLPLGSSNDSTAFVEPFSGQIYYLTKPTAVQLSSGSQDLIFYTFFFNNFRSADFQLFANAYYIRKGYNPNGEKLGDFSSVALFFGKTLFEKLGCTLQLRYENVGRMNINENILLFGKPSNYYPEATGYKKLFIAPQISFSLNKLTLFAIADIPVYQYLNTSKYYTQVGSQYQTSFGISYKFF
jgi:hypothetical protein